eukprot:3606108-Alexandrium_andersonii.AAC.1
MAPPSLSGSECSAAVGVRTRLGRSECASVRANSGGSNHRVLGLGGVGEGVPTVVELRAKGKAIG